MNLTPEFLLCLTMICKISAVHWKTRIETGPRELDRLQLERVHSAGIWKVLERIWDRVTVDGRGCPVLMDCASLDLDGQE